MVMIYGKVADLNPTDSKWLEKMDDIKLLFHQDLHAKCYINEKEAIVTSMNLFMFSQQNNVEMGIHVSKEDDFELYKQILTETDKIKRGSEHRTISIQKVVDKGVEKQESRAAKAEKATKIESIKPSMTKYLTTKEISQIIGMTSRNVNAWFVDQKMMYKKEDDWIATKKGKELGCTEKEGQYGKFVIWPEAIVADIKK